MVIRCNRLQDETFDICRCAHLSVSLERGHGLTRDLGHTRPADILIAGWEKYVLKNNNNNNNNNNGQMVTLAVCL